MTTFKRFLSDDIANTRTLLHEAIPITGSIVNKVTYTTDSNIKTYGHGMFQSVYDYPYQSSSANHIFDMTFGHSSSIKTAGTVTVPGTSADVASVSGTLAASSPSGVDDNALFKKRSNIYNQMAQVLNGHDVNGSIRGFDQDGDLTGGTKYNALLFFNFARLLGKDEIKKGTFEMKLGTTVAYNATPTSMHTTNILVKDAGAANSYFTNSPAGEYGILKASAGTAAGQAGGIAAAKVNAACGLIFYQAGVVAITPDLFAKSDTDYAQGFLHTDDCAMNSGGDHILDLVSTGTNDALSLAVRNRIIDIDFQNTTELNSTIYFCRVGHNDYNYSSNPTYTSSSKIVVKDKRSDSPVSYITTVGLYSADNEMLAVAKLSEPLRKDPTNDITLRVRLDY